MTDFNVNFFFNTLDFIVLLITVVIFFLMTSTLKNSDLDIICSRLFLEYNRITRSFNLMIAGSIFFFNCSRDRVFTPSCYWRWNVLVMKVFITIFLTVVIFFIATLNKSKSSARGRGMWYGNLKRNAWWSFN